MLLPIFSLMDSDAASEAATTTTITTSSSPIIHTFLWVRWEKFLAQVFHIRWRNFDFGSGAGENSPTLSQTNQILNVHI